jgi:alpha-ketoglutarate-dependent taurine dioxygenase
MTFRPCPPLGSILHGIIVPSEPNEDGGQAGDTEFFSMSAAYEALDGEMKAKLATLSAEHSFEKGFAESLAAPGGRERLKDMLEQNPPVVHPVLRTHPESGRTSLFVNGLFTSHIVGMDKAESDALLAELCASCDHSASYSPSDAASVTLTSDAFDCVCVRARKTSTWSSRSFAAASSGPKGRWRSGTIA